MNGGRGAFPFVPVQCPMCPPRAVQPSLLSSPRPSAPRPARPPTPQLRKEPLGERVKFSVEQCAQPITFFPKMSRERMNRFYDGLTSRQEYVLQEVDLCIQRYGEEAVLSL